MQTIEIVEKAWYTCTDSLITKKVGSKMPCKNRIL